MKHHGEAAGTYICVAGPPATGKTTAIKHLAKHYPQAEILKEPAQILIDTKNLSGGIELGEKSQREIVHIAIERFKMIIRNKNPQKLYIDESGLFNQPYARRLLPAYECVKFETQQNNLFDQINGGFLFLYASAENIWNFQTERYTNNVEKLLINREVAEAEKEKERKIWLQKYFKRTQEINRLLLDFYEKLPYPKIKLDNRFESLEKFENDVLGIFQKLLARLQNKPK